MTTSAYLQAQADLLIALRSMQLLDLPAFIAMTFAIERDGNLYDVFGLTVVTDPARMRQLALAAEVFRASAPIPGMQIHRDRLRHA